MFRGKNALALGVCLALLGGQSFAAESSIPAQPLAAIGPVPAQSVHAPDLNGQKPISGKVKVAPTEDDAAKSPDNLTDGERQLQIQQGLVEQQTRLWKAKADQAKAMADYQKAMSDYNKALGANDGAAKSESTPLPVPAPVPAQLSAKFDAMSESSPGITLIGVFGQRGHLSADIGYAGGIMRVRAKDRVGDWSIAQVEPTQIIAYRNGKKSVITLSGNSGVQNPPASAAIPLLPGNAPMPVQMAR